jgi:hypothetical protein
VTKLASFILMVVMTALASSSRSSSGIGHIFHNVH